MPSSKSLLTEHVGVGRPMTSAMCPWKKAPIAMSCVDARRREGSSPRRKISRSVRLRHREPRCDMQILHFRFPSRRRASATLYAVSAVERRNWSRQILDWLWGHHASLVAWSCCLFRCRSRRPDHFRAKRAPEVCVASTDRDWRLHSRCCSLLASAAGQISLVGG
jgi:hypothetical protein